MVETAPRSLGEIFEEAKRLGDEVETKGSATSPAAIAEMLAVIAELHRRLAFLIGPGPGWIVEESTGIPGEADPFVTLHRHNFRMDRDVELIVPDDYTLPDQEHIVAEECSGSSEKLIVPDDYEKPGGKKGKAEG